MTIINQDDAPQACPTGKHFLISYDSSLCEAHVKTTQNNWLLVNLYTNTSQFNHILSFLICPQYGIA